MFGRKKRSQTDFRREIESHVALERDRLREAGLDETAAEAHARKAFGSQLKWEERFYESGRVLWFDKITQDLRDSFRGWRRQPLFTLTVIATLALGIGACTGIFSIVDRLLFRSLPYPGASRLVSAGIIGPIDKNEFMIGRTYVDWKHRNTPFKSLTSMLPAGQCDLGDQNAIRVHCISVEWNFLRTLGIQPLTGRDFTHEDDLPKALRAALISYGLWQSRFGGKPDVTGQTMLLDGQRIQIAGVLPQDFEMPQLGAADVLIPEQLDEAAQRRANTGVFLRCFARLKDSVSMAQAREAMQPLFQSALLDAPPELRSEIHVTLRSLRDRQIRDVRLASWLLLGVVVALLFIACGNVANLLLARATAKRTQLAMRAALGASRLRLIQSSLIESLLFAVSGGIGGCVIAFLMVRVLRAVAPDAMIRLNQASIDMRALLFTLLTAVFASIFFGVVPVLERPRPETLVGWRSIGAGRGALQHFLAAFQIAMSLVLLTGATLFARSLAKLESQPLGLEPERVITATFALTSRRYPQAAAQNAFYRQVESRFEGTPGIGAFALSDSAPPSGGMRARPFSNLRIAGHPPVPAEGGMVPFRYVSPGYFQALRIHIDAGRAFAEADRSAPQPPIILSAALAHKLFPNENPIGQQIGLREEAGHSPWSTVIGVAADVRNDGLAKAPSPEYYELRTYNSAGLGRSAVAIIRTGLSPDEAARSIRREFSALDPALPVKIEAMRERVSGLSSQPRFLTLLVGLFAVFGLLLAAVGLYGVLSFLVGQRTREIGVRLAVGATPGEISSLMMGFAALWTAAGVVIGLSGSLMLSRLFRALLFDVSPRDPVSFSAALAVLVLTAALASWLPSRKAARVDPAICLRDN